MTITYPQAILNQRLTIVSCAIDAAAPTPGKIRLLDSSNQTMGLVVLALPCGTVNAGVLTFTTPAVAPGVFLDGVIAAADIEDGNGTVVASGLTVSTSTSSDIVMANNVVTASQVVTLTYATITGR